MKATPTVDGSGAGVSPAVVGASRREAPQRMHGRLAAPPGPGLGITPRFEVLGPPVLDVKSS
ncbi:MAG: hypothetical protein ABSE79_23800 [Terriglobia bacterium]